MCVWDGTRRPELVTPLLDRLAYWESQSVLPYSEVIDSESTPLPDISVGSVYSREKRKLDQTGLVPILIIWVITAH